MIGWSVPLERYPKTYNGQPLAYAGLAAQKRYYSLYLNCVYAGAVAEEDLRRRWEAGVVASTPVEEFIGAYERSRAR
jgi:hypothetical protein